MAKCEVCRNDYDKAFTLTTHDGKSHVFDSFECAIEGAAPKCADCGIRIVGHGLERDGTFFCCVSCAERKGVRGLQDRVPAGAR